MKPYCLKCRKDTEGTNSKVLSTSNGKAMVFFNGKKMCNMR